MQKPFNAEGLDLTFLFDATYPDPSITEVNNVGVASSAMPGFTPEQTSSLQQIISISICEALKPLLKPLGDFLSAWNTGPQSLPLNPRTHSISSESGYGTHPSTFDGCHDQLNSTDFVKPSVPDPVLAKRKANALDEATISVAKRNCTFGHVGKESPSEPDLKGYSLEVQVKKEPTPGTLLSEFQSSSTEDHASMFLSPAPDMQPASSQGKAMEGSSADTESVEEKQQQLADTDAGELSSSCENQSEAWMTFAESSADLKALFKDEPRTDKPCPTRDYFAEKPVSLAAPSNVYERSFPRLPFGAPLGCAHIINVSNYRENSRPRIRMADIVVTFLFNYCPDLLYAFLNVTRHPEFVFTRVEAAGRGCRNFSIERSDLTVTVTCTPHQRKCAEEMTPVEEEQYDEEALIKQFGAIGHEKMQFICEMKPWGKWVTNSCSSGGVSRQAHNPDGRRIIERYAHAFAVFIFKSRMWMDGEGVTFEGGATSA